MKYAIYLTLLTVACVIHLSAECAEGQKWVVTGNIICDWAHMPPDGHLAYVCENEGFCQEIVPEDPEWTPLIGGSAPSADVPKQQPDRPKKRFSVIT